ncbi:hypothetical protein CIW49_05095 [Mycolicibacterium sp. P1-18]|uniref:hypothetical protein n=1 Tax=Mycolicibacterium sp. P1-18 TaxID=2024615 RepID=UPI0011F09F57|nr:hypothetical protein [Mycolicibacterium sp. P1-18]KAA0100918.1 hypothetical protein CIW49_05095 [Mycolicibacterium sp. P1-18]
MTARTSVQIAIASAVLGAALLPGALATPVASADDPLGPIIGAVNRDRANTRCPQLNYVPALEDAAQKFARSENPVDGQPGNYDGRTLAFLGSGDPQAAATNSAYRRGAGPVVSSCDFTDFGVGFIRYEDRSVDVVTIVFGAPAKPVEAPKAPDPVAASPAAAPDPVKVPPTDAVRVSFDKGFQWTVNVTSTADIPGSCTYAATNPVLPGSNRNFNIGPKGSASFTVLAPPPFATYHVVVSCSGSFDGKNVEFGHVEQDVSA